MRLCSTPKGSNIYNKWQINKLMTPSESNKQEKTSEINLFR